MQSKLLFSLRLSAESLRILRMPILTAESASSVPLCIHSVIPPLLFFLDLYGHREPSADSCIMQQDSSLFPGSDAFLHLLISSVFAMFFILVLWKLYVS